MHIVNFIYAALVGSIKRTDTLDLASIPAPHKVPCDSNDLGLIHVNPSDSGTRLVFPYAHHYVTKSFAHKIRIPKPTDSEPSATTTDSNNSSSVSNCNPERPFNIAPLSYFDPNVSKEWKGKMSCQTDSESVTYTTTSGGKIVLVVIDNTIVVKVLQNMLLTIVTPGTMIKNLKEGDTLDYTVEPGHVLFVNADIKQHGFLNAQDRLHFYNKGLYQRSPKLLPHDQWTEMAMDYVCVGLSPDWPLNNNYEPFQPTLDPQYQFNYYLWSDVEELASYVVSILQNQQPVNIKPTNQVAKLNAFFSDSTFKQMTIVEYVKTISKVTDVSIPALSYYQVNPAMITVLAEITVRLFKLDRPSVNRDIWFGDCYGGSVLIMDGPTKPIIYEACTAITNLIDVTVDFDYDQVQKIASESVSFTTTMFLYFNTHTPFCFWIWEVSEEIDKEYPLPPEAKILFDSTKNYTYNTLLPMVTANYKVAVELVPNLLHRLRYQVDADLLKGWTAQAIKRIVGEASASVIREKAAWTSSRVESWDSIEMTSLPRFCNDLGIGSAVDGSKYIALSFQEYGKPVRQTLAKLLAYRLALDSEDDNVYKMLQWLPPYINAYVHDNLNAAGIYNKLSAGVNQWPDEPFVDKLNILKYWLNADWPVDRSFMVTAFTVDSSYGFSPQWLQLNKQNTALSFSAPWPNLNPTDLSTIVTKGAETVAVQSNTDNTVSIYIAKCETRRMVFHWHDSAGVCEFLVNTDWKPWSGMVKAGPNDFILVLDDPYQVEQMAQWITDSMRGVGVVETKRFVLSGFMSKSADTLFMISAPSE